MPLKSYGVLVARAVESRREEVASGTPHYQVHLVDDDDVHYRAAVNVESQQAPVDLLYTSSDDFRHPVLTALDRTGAGWHALPSAPGGASLDFIRGNLFDPAAMRPLPPDLPGVDNDLADRLDHYVKRAIADPTATVFVFGERWPSEPDVPDKVFGFRPGNGVHNVHMNQGNAGRFRADNGVWQDGGLLFRFASESRWVSVFLAFQSQAWHTDDRTGDALTDAPDRPQTGGQETVRVAAALINPLGPAPESETVTLINTSPEPVDLTGWTVADRQGRSSPLPAQALDPGAVLTVSLGGGAQLGNNGGTVTLLDPRGLKVHGVAYTREQAGREGWTVVF